MKNYNFKQVESALANRGFQPTKSFGGDTECLTIFEKSSGTQHGLEIANVEEWLEDGSCTIDGLCPSEWGKQKLNK